MAFCESHSTKICRDRHYKKPLMLIVSGKRKGVGGVQVLKGLPEMVHGWI